VVRATDKNNCLVFFAALFYIFYMDIKYLLKYARIYSIAVKLNVIPGVPNVQKPETCSTCGGKCCNQNPGITHPNQWGNNKDDRIINIADALSTGKWAVDWWEGDIDDDPTITPILNQIYYIRPVIYGYEGEVKHPSWGGKCTMLGDKGCELDHDNRPTECQSLIPNKEKCEQTKEFNKLSLVKEWRNHQSEVREALKLIDKYTNMAPW
jgi:hypothetical protein